MLGLLDKNDETILVEPGKEVEVGGKLNWDKQCIVPDYFFKVGSNRNAFWNFRAALFVCFE